MLIFTSGTSGRPKAVRITHAKVSYPGQYLSERLGLGAGDVHYLAMPLFHSNAVMAGWAPALFTGATVALREKFSASAFLDDVRAFGATYASYVGKPLTYILATPERPDDAENTLRLVFGNEAGDRDIRAFGERFGCRVVDGFGSTENAVIVSKIEGTPPSALGWPAEGVAVHDPETGRECPRAVLDADGRVANLGACVGELVNTTGAGQFAGYYNDDEATAERMRGGMYWSGDLAYRDTDGWVYFAGRTAAWLRVDGENLATAPIEQILLRHPAIDQAAVYAVAGRALRRPGGGGPDPARLADGRATSSSSWTSSATCPPRPAPATSDWSTTSPAPRRTRCCTASSARPDSPTSPGPARSAAPATSSRPTQRGLASGADWRNPAACRHHSAPLAAHIAPLARQVRESSNA